MAEPRTFVLISPHLEGSDVLEFQRLLNRRFKAWNIDKRIDEDREYGTETRRAARQVCEGLGILHEQAMRHGVTPELRSKIRHPKELRTPQEIERGKRRKEYRAKLRERYKGHGAEAALRYAREHLGETETNGSNRSPQIDEWIRTAGLDPRMNLVAAGGVPWCGCFVNACLMEAGFPTGAPWGIGAVENIIARAKAGVEGWKRVPPSQGQPGDLACYGCEHVEIVEQRISPSSYICIGGNTSNGNGSPSNGGGVFRNTRSTTAAFRITDFARPPYAS